MRDFKACTGITYIAPDDCCLFCKHCTDIFLDYTHGPYLMLCEKREDQEKYYQGGCPDFNEEV